MEYRYFDGQVSRGPHSASTGRSQGIHTGIGLSEKHGAVNSTGLRQPGRQTETFPNETQGMMWNSVLRRVGQMGMSRPRGTGPTDSGGMGHSGVHTR